MVPSFFNKAPGKPHVALMSRLQFQAPLALKHQKLTFVFFPSLFGDLKRILWSLFIHAIVFIHQPLCVIGGGIEQLVQMSKS